VLATSGTTGTPKGVVLTRSALEHSARATSERLHIDHPDRWLCCIPVAHAGGFGVIARALLTNTPLEVHDGFDADAVNRSTATRTSLVATALQRIDATRFTTILLGGDAPPLDLPANVVVTYGLTETAGGCVYDGVPLNRVDITIDADREINVAGPMRGRAYRTAEGDTPIPTGTGDSGRWEDGKLVVEGRLRDVIVTGGEKVWPAAVEAALQGQPHIKDVAVVGRPDKTWGHRVVAVVVPDGEPPTLDQLKAAVKETLPAWAAPKALELADRIPRTANNKIQRNKL
jgi:O-succinylbenzoic acid--CoA ligase